MTLKTYRAIAEGFDGDALRLPGEVFAAAIPHGSWMEEIGEDGKVIKGPPAIKPGPASAVAEASGSELADAHARIAEPEEQLEQATKPVTEQVEPGPLDQSIPELTTYLDSVGDIGAIDALIAAEKGGKSRSGALDALEARKAVLLGS